MYSAYIVMILTHSPTIFRSTQNQYVRPGRGTYVAYFGLADTGRHRGRECYALHTVDLHRRLKTKVQYDQAS